MKTNILKAILNIKKNSEFNFNKLYPPKSDINLENEIQNVGKGLEYFIKDSFADSYSIINKEDEYEKYFSYLGNSNNPPDFMIANGDAVEVKKVNGFPKEIQLNSSTPKSNLYSNDSLITETCKNCEKWDKKDLIYSIGSFENRTSCLKFLFLVYGDCYIADNTLYSNFKKLLQDTISVIPNTQKTNELGRINQIDNLGISKLRIRGMWIISNPFHIFKDQLNYNKNNQEFTVVSLMKKEKFLSFPQEDRESILNDEDIITSFIKIKDPNEVDSMMDAVLIRWDKL
ncbi:MAG: NgoPII family restriction endonuclease [Methanosphaera sp.]|uniref:NgoPII family restriction endonuclease n=1 Tax=Methanosphaera sp. TaxID=2666342 RepID=UPI0025E82D51|nr:NgoPII family restriction endonuclease [Methanosphaera sp.]MCI5866792.1 NgoPII family restriction endonuclease [Methanosphaera sp.]MDD6534306.1 NgoPII family restriction endonuclease [Methanosphaera sp.]MDY3956309.1 NgoPII family restriction endonuclease [Methanosphaera sp.]